MKATRLSFGLPHGSIAAEVFGQRVANIECELVSPAYDVYLDAGLSFRWLPWDESWRGAKIETWDMGGISRLTRDGTCLKIYSIDEMRNVEEKACEVLTGLEGPLVTELLLRLGSDKWGGAFRKAAVESLAEKGLGQEKAEVLCRSLSGLELKERWELAKELASEGLEDGGERMLDRYSRERARLYVQRLAGEVEGMDRRSRGRNIKGKLTGLRRLFSDLDLRV